MSVTADLSELLDKIDIEAYLDREGIQYRRRHGRSGDQLNVKTCPVCGNGDWKVYLNAESGVGNCFAGDHPPGKFFSKWNFIGAILDEPKPGIVRSHIEQLARDMGWRAARTTSAAVQKVQDWELPKGAIPLPVNGRTIPYLANRGITPELCAYFHLMYAPIGSYYRYRNARGEWEFQRYDQRVIIPVYDLDGKLCTFQGRDVTGHQAPKYLFPPGLEGSGVHLFNGINVHSTKRIVIGEGVFDVAAIKIALDQEHELRDVVPIGTFGMHLSGGDGNTQAAKLRELRKRGVEEVTFMWDGEVRATDAAVTAGMLLKDLGYRVRIALLPKDKDPNEVPAMVVRKAFYEAMPLDMASALHIRMYRRQMNEVQ